MIKRPITPLSKDKPLSRNISNQTRILKDIKNTIPNRQPTYTRNPSNSKLIINHQSTVNQQMNTQPNRGINPESPNMIKEIRSYTPSVKEDVRKIVVEWLLHVSHSINPCLRR